MWDFLRFHTFITPSVLLFFYYMGALFLPILLFVTRKYIFKKLHIVKTSQRWILLSIFFFFFLFMELFWRMLFEMIIAYFQMHNYLYFLVKHSS